MPTIVNNLPEASPPASTTSTPMSPCAKWSTRGLVLAALAGAALGACGRGPGGPDEMSWARAALERNEHLSVVAADPQARTFTVKLKDSGELRVIPVDQLVAGPAGVPSAPTQSPPDAAATTAASAPSAESPATPSQSPPQVANAQVPPEAAPSGEALASASESARNGPNNSTAAPQNADLRGAAADGKVGRTLASGPGYSIKATGPKNTPVRSLLVGAARGTPVERLHDPIICQGSRLLHIDNRNLEFDGDAVSAEDGCEIHITNTHISAKGIGVQARAANVYLENSEIEGESGAIDASDGAQVYAESSRFKGLTRRLAASDFHDLGGNVWN